MAGQGLRHEVIDRALVAFGTSGARAGGHLPRLSHLLAPPLRAPERSSDRIALHVTVS